MRLLVLEHHLAPVAAFQTWFAVGSGDERPGKTGMAHLFEHLMFKETKTLPAGEFDRVLEANGVSTNAATWLDWTYYREDLPASKLELVMRLEADRMQNMILNTEQVLREKEVVMNERRLRVDNDPDGKAYEVLYDLHFGSHPYGHPTIGWMEDIQAISLEDCVDFYRLHYAPNNATLVLAGDVSAPEAARMAARFYSAIPAQTPVPRAIAFPPDHPEEVVRILELPVSSPRISLLYTAPPLSEDSGVALRVLCEILCNSESARVRKMLVEDMELATDLGAWYSGFGMTGAFEVQLNLVPGTDWKKAFAVLDESIEGILNTQCAQREVEKGRNRLEMAFLRSNLTVGGRARNLGHYQTTAHDFAAYYRLLDRARQVTPAMIRDVARKWLMRGARTVVVSLPTDESSGPADGADECGLDGD